MIADRRLYLTADESQVVEDGDARAAFLFATPGTEISDADAERYGLTSAPAPAEVADDEPVKAKKAPANKARKATANKSK